MQQPVYRRLVRKRRWGHACACYACGAAVIPLPLRVNPDVRIVRAYVEGREVTNRRTGTTRQDAILFCPAHAHPDDVRDYAQFEPASTHDVAAHAARIAAIAAIADARCGALRRAIIELVFHRDCSRCGHAMRCAMMRIMENAAMS